MSMENLTPLASTPSGLIESNQSTSNILPGSVLNKTNKSQLVSSCVRQHVFTTSSAFRSASGSEGESMGSPTTSSILENSSYVPLVIPENLSNSELISNSSLMFRQPSSGRRGKEKKLVYNTTNYVVQKVIYTRSDNEIDIMFWLDKNPPIPNEQGAIYVYFGCIGDGNCLFHSFLKGGTAIYPYTYSIGTINERVLQEMESPFIRPIPSQPGKGMLTFYMDDNIFDRPRNRNNPDLIYRIINQKQFDLKATAWRMKYARLIRDDLANNYLTNENYINLYLYEKDPDFLAEVLTALPENANIMRNPNESSIRFLQRLIAGQLYGTDYVEVEQLPILGEFLDIDVYVISEEMINSNLNYKFPLAGGVQTHRYVRGPKFLRDPSDIFYNEKDRNAIVINFINNLHYELVGKQIFIYSTIQDNYRQQTVGSNVVTIFDSNEPIIVYLYLKLQERRNTEYK